MSRSGDVLAPKFLARLRSRKPDDRRAAEQELLAMGHGAVDALLRTLEAEQPKRRRNRRIAAALVGLYVVGFLASILVPGHHTSVNIGQIWIVFVLLAATRVQRNAAGALARFDDKRSVGALAEATEYRDKDVKSAVSEALVRMLPTLAASDYSLLNHEQRRALDRALVRPRQTELSLAILRAYVQIGDATSLALVERIAAGLVQPLHSEVKTVIEGLSVSVIGRASRVPLESAVVAEARAILPAMRVRAEQVQAAQTLLRPVLVDGDTSALLRPVAPSAGVDDGTLVRPVAESPEQPAGSSDAATPRVVPVGVRTE